jgi:hypothetical protein
LDAFFFGGTVFPSKIFCRERNAAGYYTRSRLRGFPNGGSVGFGRRPLADSPYRLRTAVSDGAWCVAKLHAAPAVVPRWSSESVNLRRLGNLFPNFKDQLAVGVA